MVKVGIFNIQKLGMYLNSSLEMFNEQASGHLSTKDLKARVKVKYELHMAADDPGTNLQSLYQSFTLANCKYRQDKNRQLLPIPIHLM